MTGSARLHPTPRLCRHRHLRERLRTPPALLPRTLRLSLPPLAPRCPAMRTCMASPTGPTPAPAPVPVPVPALTPTPVPAPAPTRAILASSTRPTSSWETCSATSRRRYTHAHTHTYIYTCIRTLSHTLPRKHMLTPLHSTPLHSTPLHSTPLTVGPGGCLCQIWPRGGVHRQAQ